MPHSELMEVARYRVLFDDCDPMRIMYYGSYYRLFEIGWTELFRRLGHPLPVYMARGLYLAVIEVNCRYQKPARYDDELIIKAALTDIGPARFEIHYEIAGIDGAVVVSGSSWHAILNEENRPQRVPAEIIAAAKGG